MHRLIRTPILMTVGATVVTSAAAGFAIHHSVAADPPYPMTTVTQAQMEEQGITLRSSSARVALTRDAAVREALDNWAGAQVREAVHVHVDARNFMLPGPNGKLLGQPYHGEAWAVSIIHPGGIRSLTGGGACVPINVCPPPTAKPVRPLIPPGAYDIVFVDAQTGQYLGEVGQVPPGY